MTSPVRIVVSRRLSSMVRTGLARTVCFFSAVTPSAEAEIVTVPAARARTLPKRSTVAISGLELRQVGFRSGRSVPFIR